MSLADVKIIETEDNSSIETVNLYFKPMRKLLVSCTIQNTKSNDVFIKIFKTICLEITRKMAAVMAAAMLSTSFEAVATKRKYENSVAVTAKKEIRIGI